MPGASPLWMAGLLTLWAASIAIWKPQPIHILELYQVEGGSHLVHALKGLEDIFDTNARELLQMEQNTRREVDLSTKTGLL